MQPLFRLSALLALAAVILPACQASAPAPKMSTVNMAALPTMERVALAANRCWFKSNDPAFKAYRLAPELNSFSGRPRILLVRRNAPEARPLAVVQAEGQPARMQAFGPLFAEPIGPRMTGDIRRWATGEAGC